MTRSRLGRFVVLEDRTAPATFTVNSAADTAVAGTLRAAVALANASPDRDTIDITTPDPINLTAALPDLKTAIDIRGRGANRTSINANGFRPFAVQNTADPAAAFDVTFRDLTIGRGTADRGGAVYAKKAVAFTGVTLSGNQATDAGGAVFGDATEVTFTNSRLIDNTAANGGAVAVVGGALRVTGSTFGDEDTRNIATAGLGGGIAVTNATLEVTASTFVRNRAQTAGGAVALAQTAGSATTATFTGVTFERNEATVDAGGGLLAANGTTATVVGSTFDGNTAGADGGGLAVTGGAVTLTNSTLANNAAARGAGAYLTGPGVGLNVRSSTFGRNAATGKGGGVFVDQADGAGAVRLTNTLVAQNTAAAGPDVFGQVQGGAAGNLIGNGAGSIGISHDPTGNKNQVGGQPGAPTTIDPLFAPMGLGFNGGRVKTLRITAGSPAEGTAVADTAGLTSDNRGTGFARVVGALDVGAFEIQTPSSQLGLVVTTAADELDATFDPADLSLREALAYAGTDAPTITFSPTVLNQTLTLFLGALRIDRPVTITGPGAKAFVIDGNARSQVFVVDFTAGPTDGVAVSGLTLRNGASDPLLGGSGNGGAIETTVSLSLTGVTVADSKAAGSGGGVFVAGGTFALTDGTVSGNTATQFGGGIELFGFNTAAVVNSTVSGNGANLSGGGIHVNFAAAVAINSSTIAFNTADAANVGNRSGGGIAADAQTVTMKSSVVAGNGFGTGNGNFGPDISGKVNADVSLVQSLLGWDQSGSAGTNKVGVNPLLAPLAFNGGSTKTHALSAGSPALDAGGNPSGLAFDQRGTGFPRAANGRADIGAFEFATNTAPTVSTPRDQAVVAGVASAAIPITVGDAETAAADLILTATSSNLAVLSAAGLTLGGSGANRTLVVTPTAGATGTSTVTLTVADAAGATTTSTFVVTVGSTADTAPTITAIPDVGVLTGTPTAALGFLVGDGQTPAAALVVTAASSNLTLVPVANVVLGGTGANRTVIVTPAAGQTGTAVVTLTVIDAAGLTATEPFLVTVSATGNTSPTIGDIADRTVSVGQTTGPLAFTVGDAETAVGALALTATTSNPALVPLTGIAFGGAGATRSVTANPTAGVGGSATITVTVTDGSGLTASDSFVLTVVGGGNPAGTGRVGYPQYAAGTDKGDGRATLFNPDQTPRFTTTPFPGFTGGVRTAAGDFNGDGVADLVVGTGPGRATQVRILDGATQAQLFTVDPFEAAFTGGVYVDAGDVTGDGVADLIISPDEGGGPRVRVFDGKSFGVVADFFGIDDANFRGGARAAVGDLNGDGRGDLIVAAGFGGGPRVAAFNGNTLVGNRPVKLFNDFFAFEVALRNGVFIAAGDIDGDGFADLIAGGGPGGGPRVTAFDGKSLQTNTQVVRANFFGGDTTSRGGIRVAVKDLDNDARADIVVGSGTAAGSRVTGYLGKNIPSAGTPASVFDADAFPGFTGGVFVK